MSTTRFEPCPFCGKQCKLERPHKWSRMSWIACISCRYRTGYYWLKNETIAAHNRVSRAVAESKQQQEESK